jgi:hypothetical protein
MNAGERVMGEDGRRSQLHDIFAADFSHVEIIGTNIRLIWTVPESRDQGAPRENVPVAQIILPLAAVRSMLQRLMFALGEALPEPIPQPQSLRMN